MSEPLASLPVNMTDRTRVFARLAAGLVNVEADRGAIGLPLEAAEPLRRFYAWNGKKNYEGRWWSSTVRKHLPYESLLEAQYLLTADFDREVRAISAQSIAFLWPRGLKLRDGKMERSHIADFFVRLDNNEGRVIDVRDPDHAHDPVFRYTAAVCAEIGWQYQVYTGLEQPLLANLKWLGGYRADRYRPDDTLRSAILDACAVPAPFERVTARVVQSASVSPNVVTAAVLYLLFESTLEADLRSPLTLSSEVVARQEVRA